MECNGMQNELEYYKIGDSFGGNQEWFRNVLMYMGGCAAATACDSCIYLALRQGKEKLYPYDIHQLTKEDYIQFSMVMKPYLRPRVQGINKLSLYIEGFAKYLQDTGMQELKMGGFPGEYSAEKAAQQVKNQIDKGFPVPYLMLHHTMRKFKDFNWHWFLVVGYEETASDFKVKVATYGEATVFSLEELWNTGFEEKGGMILYEWEKIGYNIG